MAIKKYPGSILRSPKLKLKIATRLAQLRRATNSFMETLISKNLVTENYCNHILSNCTLFRFKLLLLFKQLPS